MKESESIKRHARALGLVVCAVVVLALLAGCVTNTPLPGAPQVIIHAPENTIKNFLVNDLVNKQWNPVSDSQFTITLDKRGGFWQNVFFGSQWNPQTLTRMRLTFINTGDGTRVICHNWIVSNPGSGWQQQTEIDGDWPRIQYWLDCMAADLEQRPRPPEPDFLKPKPVTSPHGSQRH